MGSWLSSRTVHGIDKSSLISYSIQSDIVIIFDNLGVLMCNNKRSPERIRRLKNGIDHLHRMSKKCYEITFLDPGDIGEFQILSNQHKPNIRPIICNCDRKWIQHWDLVINAFDRIQDKINEDHYDYHSIFNEFFNCIKSIKTSI